LFHAKLYVTMTKSKEFLDLVAGSFPVAPVPARFFWPEQEMGSLDGDMPQELGNRISGRRWTEVTLVDWRMIGTPPCVSRLYLEPATFMYYLPSIIVGVSQEMEFWDFALEAIIPYNKNRVPRGRWWSQFSASASPQQRAALSVFLAHIRLMSWDRIGLDGQYFLEKAEKIWSG
jgi:hypothetical protein